MNKKIERLITIGMIAGLVEYFCYQVAYGEKFRYLDGHVIYPAQSMAVIWDMPLKNNDCTRGWHDGWNQYCTIGMARYPDLGSDALCPMNSDGKAVNNV